MTTAHALRVGGRQYPVVLPTFRDPRMHLATVIVSVQILGQTLLDFDLSIAQILTSLVTCATIELAITFRRQRAIVWPGSALLTGNGVALILRVPGTEHGDWWSMKGWYYFAGIAAFSLLTKYVIRYRGSHVFNPSNIGLVVGFLVLGENRVEPLDFWWGPLSPGVALATLIIVVGGLIITSRLKLLGMAAGFWVTFALSLAVVAAAGHCMTATWHFGPICGASFWWVLVTSPEVLIFLFFMITDPKTTPSGRVARVVFGVAVGFVAVLLAAPQETEFATKVAVLASLVVVCVARYPMARFLPAAGSGDDSFRTWLPSMFGGHDTSNGVARVRLARMAGVAAIVVGFGIIGLVAAGTPAREIDGNVRADGAIGGRDAAIDEASLPPLVISDEMRRINPELRDSTARLMAVDVLADLEAEREALRNADPAIAARGSTLIRLDDLNHQIEMVGDGQFVELPEYDIDSMAIVPVYDPKNAQSGPQFGVEVRGTVRFTSIAGSPPTTGETTVAQPFERTYALYLEGDRYLIAADYPVE